MTSELVPLDTKDLVIARPPEIVLEEARRAAVALKEVIDSGEYKTIYTKWFHKPVPPGIGSTTHKAS